MSQLIQELIGGVVERHVFSPWELELMLDLETCHVRRQSRPTVLRRYLKAMQQQLAEGHAIPVRLSLFLESEKRQPPAKRSRHAVRGIGA